MVGSLRTVSPGSPYVPVDYHMHTEFSDGGCTVREYANAASRLGLSEIAITDHVWRSSDWVAEYVDTIDRVRDETDLEIHAGLEAKVIDDDGRVDASPDDVDRVDFVMGVVHRYQPENEAPRDDMLNFEPDEAAARERDLTLSLLANDVVDVVGHPSRTYYKFFYGDRTEEPYPTANFEAMIERSAETGTPLEHNARLPAAVRSHLLDLYVAHGLPFTVGSDSHRADGLSNLDHERLGEVVR